MNESYPNISIPGTVISPMTRNSFRSTSFRSFRPRRVKQWRFFFFYNWWSILLIPNPLTQEMRKIFRDATTELLTRLTRVCGWQDKDFHFQTHFNYHHCQRQYHGQVDLTETLFNDVVPIGLQHLDSYLWAVHHVEQEVADIMNKAKTIIIDQHILLSSWGSWSLFHLGLLQTRKGREKADQYLAGLHGERGLVNIST